MIPPALLLFLFFTVVQRLGLKMLISHGVDNPVFLNILMFFGMGVAGFAWARSGCLRMLNFKKLPPPLIFAILTEVVGGILQMASLFILDASSQSILSRGAELLVVVLLTHWVPSSTEVGISKGKMLSITALLLLGTLIIPFFAAEEGVVFTRLGILLVALRSSMMAIQTVCEQVAIQNHGKAPGEVLLVEAFYGMLLALTILLPGFSLLDRYVDLPISTIPGSFSALTGDFRLIGGIAMLAVFAFSNFSRLYLIERHSALTKEIVAAARPGLVWVLSLVLFYAIGSKKGIGEEWQWMKAAFQLGCLSIVIFSNFLYMRWLELKSLLYKLGLEAMEHTGLTENQRKQLEFICVSGIKHSGGVLGCYARCAEDYDAFQPFFIAVTAAYHEYNVNQALGLSIDHDLTNVNSDRPVLDDAFCWNKVVSLRMRVARNLSGFEFPSIMTAAARKQVARIVLDSLEMYVLQNDLKTDWIVKPYSDVPEVWPSREFGVMTTSGLTRDWPNDRYHCTMELGSNIQLGVLINEEDHLRIFVTAKNPTLNVLHMSIDALASLERHLNHHHSFATHPMFGYLASCPSNVGTGFKVSTRGYAGINMATEIRLGVTVSDILRVRFGANPKKDLDTGVQDGYFELTEQGG